MPSMKNSPLSPSVAGDLGLGDQLRDDVQAQLLERRKKMSKLMGQDILQPGATMGLAASQMFPNMNA